MHYAVLSLRRVRMAVVLVEIGQIHNEMLITRLQIQMAVPVMLVARDDSDWRGLKAWAQFDTAPYMAALLSQEDVEWTELSAPAEPDPPF